MNDTSPATPPGQGPQRTSPLGLLPQTIHNLRQSVFPIIAAWFGIRSADLGLGLAMFAAVAILVIGLLAAIMRWWRTTYETGPQDIRVEKGIVSRSARSVPYERIQDVSLNQPLVPRLFGLVELAFETGAGGKDDLKLTYVTEEEGHRLRRLVRERRAASLYGPEAASAEEGAEAPDTPVGKAETEELLFSMSPGRVALFGLFEFSLVIFGVLAAGLQQFEFLLPFDIWEASEWRDRFGGVIGWLIGTGVQAQVVAAIFGLISVALVGVFTGVFRTFARDFGFTLSRSERGFRRKRGLFTRTDVVMPVHRVQGATISTGVVRRIWGWRGLKFISLAQDASSASHDVAPFAQAEEILPIMQEAQLALPPADTAWQRPVPARWLVGWAWWSIFVLYGSAQLWWWLDPRLGVALTLVGLPFIAIRQWFNWRQYRYAADERQLYFRSGWLNRKLVLAPRQRIQSVEITQGPLGKLAGYVDLHFGLPGGKLRFTGVRSEVAENIRAQVADTISATDYSRSAAAAIAGPSD